MFCAWIAVTISGTVIRSFANWSGFTHSRMAYWPAPKIWIWPTPFTRVDGIVQIDVGVVGQESRVVGALRRV